MGCLGRCAQKISRPKKPHALAWGFWLEMCEVLGAFDDAVALFGSDEVEDAVGFEEVVGEAEVDAADVVEAFEVVVGQLDLSGGQRVLDLADLAGADDGDDAVVLVHGPRGGDLRGGVAEFVGDGVDGAGDGERLF